MATNPKAKSGLTAGHGNTAADARLFTCVDVVRPRDHICNE